LDEFKKKEDFSVIFNGTNIDDLSDIGPGIDAAKQKNIVSPLVKCKNK
jgi:ATP-utilizing enzymes of the PP-loop superfamily